MVFFNWSKAGVPGITLLASAAILPIFNASASEVPAFKAFCKAVLYLVPQIAFVPPLVISKLSTKGFRL